MPRPARADEAGGLFHALNRGNPCHTDRWNTIGVSGWAERCTGTPGGSRVRRSVMRAVLSQPWLQKFDRSEEVVTNGNQQIDAVEVLTTADAVSQIIPGLTVARSSPHAGQRKRK